MSGVFFLTNVISGTNWRDINDLLCTCYGDEENVKETKIPYCFFIPDMLHYCYNA